MYRCVREALCSTPFRQIVGQERRRARMSYMATNFVALERYQIEIKIWLWDS